MDEEVQPVCVCGKEDCPVHVGSSDECGCVPEECSNCPHCLKIRSEQTPS